MIRLLVLTCVIAGLAAPALARREFVATAEDFIAQFQAGDPRCGK